MLTGSFYLTLSMRLVALSMLIHGLEFLKLRATTGDLDGIWRWSDLAGELGGTNRYLQLFFSSTLKEKPFYGLNLLRVLVASLTFFSPNVFCVTLLLAFHVLTILRWRGTFNGGSDSILLLTLLAGLVGLVGKDNPSVVIGALWFITIHSVFSYFKSGYLKILDPNWRKGRALVEFLNSSLYEPKPFIQNISQSTIASASVAWIVLIFEVSFPGIFLFHQLVPAYLVIGFLFHLVNVYVFGLNRFLFAWAATYPAIFYCAGGA